MTGHERLIRHYTSRRAQVLGYLRSLVRDAHLAEDLFQETCIVVLKKLGSFDQTLDFDAWVRGIARNLARNALRRNKSLTYMPGPELVQAIEHAHAESSAEESGLMVDRLNHLYVCMERLAPKAQEVLELRYKSDVSIKEIALRTGRRSGSVQVALSRIRRFLLGCIERQMETAHGA